MGHWCEVIYVNTSNPPSPNLAECGVADQGGEGPRRSPATAACEEILGQGFAIKHALAVELPHEEVLRGDPNGPTVLKHDDDLRAAHLLPGESRNRMGSRVVHHRDGSRGVEGVQGVI